MATTVTWVSPKGRARDPRSEALARSLSRAITDFNAETPGGQRVKIDSNLSRVLANDPDRKRSKLAKGLRVTENPSILYLMDLADQMGTTVGALLGEKDFRVTDADRERVREFIAWLTDKFSLSAAAAAPNPEENVLEFVPSRATFEVIEEAFRFSVPREEFKAKDFDYPQPWHYWTTDEPVEARLAAGPVGVPNLLNPKTHSVREVLDRVNQIVRIQGDSMVDRYFDGDLVRVDTRIRTPLDGSPIAVYCDDLGGSLVGFLKHEGDRIILVKKNAAHRAVVLPESDWILIGPVVELVSRQERRERV